MYEGDEFAIEIKEPIPTQREWRMEMDDLRFQAGAAKEEAKEAKAQVEEAKARENEAKAKAEAAAEENRLLKELLAQKDAKGAKKSKQVGSWSGKRKR